MTHNSRTVIITGGGTGIGAATAHRFAAQGTAVALVGRRPGPLEETVMQIRRSGGTAIAIPADLADPATPEKLVSIVISEWDRLDMIVNNATAIQHMPIQQANQEWFDMHYAVNIRAPYFLIQAALPYLLKSDYPAVVNISSSSASMSIPGQSMYGMSKAALEYLTRSLAAELAPKVRVNCIAPGPVDTPIHLKKGIADVAGEYQRMVNGLPLGRMGTANELGAWIVWLCSPESSFVTGAVIPVDGGQTLQGALSRPAK